MKLKTGILVLAMTASAAWAQNPDVIQNTRDTMKAVQQKATLDQNAALAASPAPAAKAAPAPATVKTVASKPTAGKSTAAPKAAAASAKPEVASVKPAYTGGKAAARPAKAAARKPSQPEPKAAANAEPPAEASGTDKKETASVIHQGRDPFVSPVVQHIGGSGCSTGKRCLAIDQIALKGVVRSENGMIAVVVNALDKAYFLRENDPVFNGYVVRITGDSIIFKETFQDRLGKSATREVVKRIIAPAV